MRRTALATIERGGVLREVRSGPPLTLRRVGSQDRRVCRLCLVNSAAGPLAGDDVALELELQAGAEAELIAAGASIAQGRPGGTSTAPGRLSSQVRLGVDARLIAEPAPLIVCQGARVELSVDISLADGAAVDWQETLVLGRSGEAGGSVVLRWALTRDRRPVLRSLVDLTDPQLTAWPGMVSNRRVMVTAVISDPAIAAATIVLDPTAVIQRVDDHTVVATVLDDDAATAQLRMMQLRSRLRPSASN